jgi:hypothetical protein
MKLAHASIVVSVAIVIMVGLRPALAQEAPPSLLSIEGVLLDGQGQPRTGTVTLIVSFYTNLADTTAVWSEEQEVTLGVEGQYSIMAGSTLSGGLPRQIFIQYLAIGSALVWRMRPSSHDFACLPLPMPSRLESRTGWATAAR